jgi:hypothetical protein
VHSFVLPTARVLPSLTVPPEAVDPDDLGGVSAARSRRRAKAARPRARVAKGKAKRGTKSR